MMKQIVYLKKEDYDRLDEENCGQILFNEHGLQPFLGGLDHIEFKKNEIRLYDIGTNYHTVNYVIRCKKN